MSYFTDGQLIALALVFQGVLMAFMHAYGHKLVKESTDNHKGYYEYLKLRDSIDRNDRFLDREASRKFAEAIDKKEKND